MLKNILVILSVMLFAGSAFAQGRWDSSSPSSWEKKKAPPATEETAPAEEAAPSPAPSAPSDMGYSPPSGGSAGYKSDLPEGWEQPTQVKSGEITLEQLEGRPIKPSSQGAGVPSAPSVSSEPMPTPSAPETTSPQMEEESVSEEAAQPVKGKKTPTRWQ